MPHEKWGKLKASARETKTKIRYWRSYLRYHRNRLETKFIINRLMPGLSSLPYVYDRLDPKKDQIRILRLYPSKEFTDDIRIDLSTWNCHDVSGAQYIAFSYTWGSTQDLEQVFDVFSGKSLSVTRNLAQALRHFRIPNWRVALWIDAICINQEDDAEKSRQIQLMPWIFATAKRALAWVGPENASRDPKLAIECFKRISEHVSVDWERRTLEATTDDASSADMKTPLPCSSEELISMVDFLHRPWFSRLWVCQEVQLGFVSRNKASLWCGSLKVPWRAISTSIFLLSRRAKVKISSTLETAFWDSYHALDFQYLYCLCEGVLPSLVYSLDSSNAAQCSDARDRVYAMLALVEEAGAETRISPDYGKNYREVYTEVAAAHLAVHSNLEFLHFVERRVRTPEFPSWVPDWSTHLDRSVLGYQAAGTLVSVGETKVDGQTLRARGKLVARVAQIAPFEQDECIECELRRMIFPEIAEEIVRGNVELLESVCRVITGDVLDEKLDRANSPPDLEWPTLNQCKDLVLAALHCPSCAEWSAGVERKVLSLCRGRSLLMSECSMLGVGPRDMQLGDEVAVLCGCSTAVILRRIDNTRCRFVGVAFFSGVMEREALIGQVPKPYRLLRKVRPSGIWDEVWKNFETGETVSEDPRSVRDLELQYIDIV